MLDSNDLLVAIKKMAVEAVTAAKPTAVIFGKVVSIVPLKISIDQKMTLGLAQLVLTRAVSTYQVEMTVNHTTQPQEHTHTCPGEGCNIAPNSHSHVYAGTKIFTVHSGLVVGDEVVLIQMQGGQKYLVWDRVMT